MVTSGFLARPIERSGKNASNLDRRIWLVSVADGLLRRLHRGQNAKHAGDFTNTQDKTSKGSVLRLVWAAIVEFGHVGRALHWSQDVRHHEAALAAEYL